MRGTETRTTPYIHFRYIQFIHPTNFAERDPGLQSSETCLDILGFEETLK